MQRKSNPKRLTGYNKMSRRTSRAAVAVIAIILVLLGYQAMRLSAAEKSPDKLRKAAAKAEAAGNFKDAYDSFNKLALDPADDPLKVGSDLQNGVNCLQQLARDDESDDFREQVVGVHKTNWRLLQAASESYQNDNHQGFIVAGKFYRGNRHGNDGKFTNAVERDRVRALQLMQDAALSAAREPSHDDAAQFYFAFSDMLLDRRYSDGAWRLQYLTDLTKLPDYEDGYGNGYYGGGNGRGAVDEKGQPVFHAVPKSWEAARTDGERWRWCLVQAAEFSPKFAPKARYVLASFLREQFDVQTMQQAGYTPDTTDNDTRKDESGPYAVTTLKENETIARLANGIKRFDLPNEYNFIKILQSLGDGPNTDHVAENALCDLAGIFSNRQQYDRSAEYWRTVIQKYGPGDNKDRQAALDQIVKNWVEFESGSDRAGRQRADDPAAFPQRQKDLLRRAGDRRQEAADGREGLHKDSPQGTRLPEDPGRRHRVSSRPAESGKLPGQGGREMGHGRAAARQAFR